MPLQRVEAALTNVRLQTEKLEAEQDFEITSDPVLALFSFRFAPPGYKGDLDALNRDLVNAINDDGRIYLTQTRINGDLVIRFQAGQFETTKDDVMMAHTVITEIARGLS